MAVAADEAVVLRQLANPDPLERVAGLTALKDMAQAEAQAALVAGLLGDSHWDVRRAAVSVFVALGARAVAQAPKLGALVEGCDAGASAAAASALAGMGAAAVSQIGALEVALAKREEDRSVHALAIAGVAAKPAVTLRKPACAAAAALAALGPEAARSAPRLVECLRDGDRDIRAAGVAALGAMGTVGAQYEGLAFELLSDPSPVVVAAACQALGGMARGSAPSESVAGGVAELLASRHPMVRFAAARGLAEMREEAEPHAEAVARLLHDAAPSVQIEAMRALARMGETGQMHAPGVARLLGSASQLVRAEACASLARMGERGAAFAEEVSYLQSTDCFYEVQDAASLALEAMLRAEPQAIAATEGAAREALPVALLFPGQGSQYVGMLKDVQEMPAVKEMLDKAAHILGYDVLELCLNGPEERLESTRFCQPCMYIAGLAGVEVLRRERPDLVERARAVAGLSLGEYTALTVAGVFSFEEGLRLVKLRAEAMQEAAESSPQLMASVAGLDEATLSRLCRESAQPGETCKVANFLFPNGFSCAGSKAAIERLVEKAQAANALQAKVLKTSGAFHTDLMSPAKAKLLRALEDSKAVISAPKCDVYLNVTGKRFAAGSDPSHLLPLLADQLCSCVLWEPSMRLLISDGIKEFYECGPMKQLKAMQKRIDQEAWKNTTNMHV